MTRYITRVGEEFEADEATFDQQKSNILREKTIGKVCMMVLGTDTFFLIGSSIFGLVEGDFHKLGKVYELSMPLVMLLIGYLFGRRAPE